MIEQIAGPISCPPTAVCKWWFAFLVVPIAATEWDFGTSCQLPLAFVDMRLGRRCGQQRRAHTLPNSLCRLDVSMSSDLPPCLCTLAANTDVSLSESGIYTPLYFTSDYFTSSMRHIRVRRIRAPATIATGPSLPLHGMLGF